MAWRFWKGRAWMAALCCLALTACGGGYAFDEAARDGAYSQPTGRPAQSASFYLAINGEMTVDMQTGRANALISNPAENTKDCRVVLVLDGTGETLFETEVLRPGERIPYIELDGAKLPFIENTATARFEILEPDTGDPAGQVEAGVLIIKGILQ